MLSYLKLKRVTDGWQQREYGYLVHFARVLVEQEGVHVVIDVVDAHVPYGLPFGVPLYRVMESGTYVEAVVVGHTVVVAFGYIGDGSLGQRVIIGLCA